jgi:uncharacterized protein (DUF433 family)
VLTNAKAQTVSRWLHGYFPVFADSKERGAALSYLQLVELAFAASFREVGISLQRVRKAHEYLSKVFQVEYPFAQLELKSDGVHILKELQELEDGHRNKLVVADKDGQEAWPELIAKRLDQFDYEFGLALRWHPRGKQVPIIVDPRISFGAPIVAAAGIATWVLKERYEAGETIEELQEDFQVSRQDLHTALAFEGLTLAA